MLLLLHAAVSKSDCKRIETTSSTLPPPTTTARPYPGCGVKLDFEIRGTIVGGTKNEENSHPWIAFLFNFDRDFVGLDVMELDLPQACKPTTTST